MVGDGEHGPYITVAGFCERILTEADGVQSLIRIVDQLTHREVGPDAPEELGSFTAELWYLLALKPGEVRGEHRIRLNLVMPDGSANLMFEDAVEFDGDADRGISLGFQMVVEYTQVGLHWLEAYFDDRLLTRSVLRINYQRGPQAPASTGA